MSFRPLTGNHLVNKMREYLRIIILGGLSFRPLTGNHLVNTKKKC